MFVRKAPSADELFRRIAPVCPALQKNWLLYAMGGIGCLLIACGWLWFAKVDQQEKEAQQFFNNITQLVARHDALKSAVGDSQPQLLDGTFFSRVEKVVQELKLKKRVTSLRTSSGESSEQVQLAVSKLQTGELVRLLYRIENTLGPMSVVRARFDKRKQGIDAELVVQPQ